MFPARLGVSYPRHAADSARRHLPDHPAQVVFRSRKSGRPSMETNPAGIEFAHALYRVELVFAAQRMR